MPAEEGYATGMRTGIRVLEDVYIPQQEDLPVVDIGVRQYRGNHHNWTPPNALRFNRNREVGLIVDNASDLIR